MSWEHHRINIQHREHDLVQKQSWLREHSSRFEEDDAEERQPAYDPIQAFRALARAEEMAEQTTAQRKKRSEVLDWSEEKVLEFARAHSNGNGHHSSSDLEA